MKRLVVFLLPALMAGCASTSLYQWGGYDALLYHGYKTPDKMTEMRVALEAHVLKLQDSGQKVAPGLYSEIATVYLQGGDRANAARYYALEKAAWPESQGLMDALIANLGKNGAAQ